MKRITFIIFTLFLLNTPLVFAQQAEITDRPTSYPAEQTASQAGSLDYQLPYPGLLPDNPLYSLKTFRDKIISFLISDPAKKAEFNLLQADKRLNAGFYLFNKQQGKEQLVVSTISKGVNYLEQAIKDEKEASKKGIDLGDLPRRIELSVMKHQQIVKSLREKSSPGIKSQFIQIEKKLTTLAQQVKPQDKK